MINSVVRSVSIPKDILAGLDRIARQQKRPRSRVLADAARRYYALWMLERDQAVGRKYAERLGIRTDEDVYRILES